MLLRSLHPHARSQFLTRRKLAKKVKGLKVWKKVDAIPGTDSEKEVEEEFFPRAQVHSHSWR